MVTLLCRVCFGALCRSIHQLHALTKQTLFTAEKYEQISITIVIQLGM